MCFLLVLKNKRQAVTPCLHRLLLWQPESERANSGRLQPGPRLNPWQGGRQSGSWGLTLRVLWDRECTKGDKELEASFYYGTST